jgi:hypothetical protein
MVRWVNLGLAALLATLLIVELTRSTQTEPPGPAVTAAPPLVVQETPGRRSRRMEAKMALEEARRKKREQQRVQAGRILLGEDGRPILD